MKSITLEISSIEAKMVITAIRAQVEKLHRIYNDAEAEKLLVIARHIESELLSTKELV